MTLRKYYLLASLLLFIIVGCSKSESEIPENEIPENEIENPTLLELGDVTKQMVLLGNPLTAKYANNTPSVYARNIWDMHAFNNKIYFGGGNSSNSAPAANAGPADLWVYDTTSQEFIKEYTVHDEQIHLIREFDNQLYIPGHDARESWALGNFYRLEKAGWKKYRTIPNAIHVYDIYKWEDKLFAAIGPQSPTANIQVSYDDGLTWQDAEYTNDKNMTIPHSSRIYSIFPFSGKLYMQYVPYPLFYTGNKNILKHITNPAEAKALYDGEKAYRIERAVLFGEYTAYILGKTHNDHQYLPVSLRYANNWENVIRYELPENTLPRDILVKDDYLIVLFSKQAEEGTFYNTIMATSDLPADVVEWTELFGFTAETFARSFEYLNGTFYFGLGCEEDNLIQATGNILKFNYEL